MVVPNMPSCPDSLKALNHYLNIASEHDGRDIVVSYWCRLYALQQGLKIDKTSPEAKKLLYFLMDWLEAEKEKEKSKDNEAVMHEIPAQAYLENYALKLFKRADEQDRAAIFNKNVVKAFYTAGMLYAMLEMFGELTEEVANNQKYAKWKAAYIHNCLKTGETPVPGPAGGQNEEEDELAALGFRQPGTGGENVPPSNPADSGFPAFPLPVNAGAGPYPPVGPGPAYPPVGPGAAYPPVGPGSAYPPTGPAEGGNFPTPGAIPKRVEEPARPSPSSPAPSAYNIPPEASYSGSTVSIESGIALTPEIIAKAQKLCKYASSALNYDDVKTAVTNLTKALSLLATGKEE